MKILHPHTNPILECIRPESSEKGGGVHDRIQAHLMRWCVADIKFCIMVSEFEIFKTTIDVYFMSLESASL